MRDREAHKSGSPRLAALLTGGVIGTVLAILAASAVWPTTVGPLAYIAIATVGSVAGSALTVLAASAPTDGRRTEPTLPDCCDGRKRAKDRRDPARFRR